jgi:hypothetical protein
MKRSAPSSSSLSSASQDWNRETEILASSMTLVSISEQTGQTLQYKSSMGSLSSSSQGSGNSLHGWGSDASRKSYKVDLCALGEAKVEGANTFHLRLEPALVATELDREMGESWGYFVDSH